MNKLAYDVFFEKVSGVESILRQAAPFVSEFLGQGAKIVPKAAKKGALGKVLGVAFPVGFMGMEGIGKAKEVRQGIYNLPRAKSMPQIMNPFQTF